MKLNSLKTVCLSTAAVLASVLFFTGCTGQTNTSATAAATAAASASSETGAVKAALPVPKEQAGPGTDDDNGRSGKSAYEEWKYSKRIDVSASCDKTVIPDKANITIKVNTKNKDPKVCYSQNTDQLNAAIEAIKAAGIAEDSIQTADLNLSEEFHYDQDSGKQVSDGYKMTSSLIVSGFDIAKVGDVISAGVGAGTNEIESLKYESSKYDETYQAALTEATELAKKKAEAMAAAGGSTVKDLISVSEDTPNVSARYSEPAVPVNAMAEKSAGTDALPTVQSSPGKIEIHASVSAAFWIDK